MKYPFNVESTVLITCPLRIAPLLSRETTDLGFQIVRQHPAGVEIKATLADTLRLNLHLRTGSRVLFRVAEGRAATPQDMYRLINNVEWETFLHADGYFSVISSVDTPSIDNTMFANMKCKDAIADRMRETLGKRPDSGSDMTGAVIFLYWRGSYCAAYIDSSGEPLSKRGWRAIPYSAPLRENLAASIIMSARWNPHNDIFVNPMCGSGTLAIEAAMAAQNKPSVWNRQNFSFMSLRGYNPENWESLRDEAKRSFKQVERGRIIASDLAGKAIEAVRKNAQAAGVGDLLIIEKCDFAATQVPVGEGAVILNPEYGMRLGEEEDLREIYNRIGDFFKQRCGGKFGYVFTGNSELAKCVGLRPKRRMEFYNADIDCRLIEYELYEGSRKKTFLNEVEPSTESSD